MIADAVDTVCTLGVALLAWIAVTVLAATLALHAVVAVVWWAGRATVRGVKAARAWLYARLSHELPPGGPSVATMPERRSEPHAPSWARTDKDAA